MKIILTVPPVLNNNSDKIEKRNHIRRGLLPPLGIGYIAAVLIQYGHEVKIIDAQVLDYTLDETLDEVNAYKPDIVGVSFLTPQANSAFALIEKIKRHFRNLPIVAGGAHPTCFPRETMEKCQDIDILVFGEGEYTMLNIIRCLQEGRSLAEVKGVYYHNDAGEVIETLHNDQIIDLETLPFPARNLYPLTTYAPEPFENKKLPSTNIIVSRGCTYAQCTFCYRSGLLKRAYRIQSVKKTIEEVRYLIDNFGIKECIFYDDDLGANKKWLKEFCILLCKEKVSIIWSFRARPNEIDYEILQQAKDAGCFSVSFGFESGNQDLLDTIKKGITLEQSRKAAYLANALGLEVVGTFMLALPGETPEKAAKTIQFAIELDCTYAAFIPTHPFFGTQLYEQCVREGKMMPPAYSKNMRHTRYLPEVTYIPSGYRNKEEIAHMIKKAYKDFYFRPRYFLKHIKKIKRFEDLKRYWDGFTFLRGLS